MHARLVFFALLVTTITLGLAHPAGATTINPVPDILPVVWPLNSTTAALNVTFALHDCTSTSGGCTTQAVTSGTTPTFTLTQRAAGALPVVSATRAMIACGGGYWCWNETIQLDNATGAPYFVYAGLVMWSTGLSPANTWSGQTFVVTAKEVRLTSSVKETDLPESRGHANATWVGNAWFNNSFRPAPTLGSLTATSITATRLTVGSASATDLTVLGAMQTQTAFDPYVMPLVFGGLTVFSTAASLWIARKPGILGKLAIAILLVVASVWAAGASVSSDANAFRWVAVVITSGWAIIVIFSMKDRR